MLVGILGGGQLGQMLCQAASQIGIKVLTLDPLENYPTSSLSHQHIVGNFNDGSAVLEFAKRFSALRHSLQDRLSKGSRGQGDVIYLKLRTSIGHKGRSYLLLLLRMKQLVVETVDGCIKYHACVD
ncbi:uncharacterized protein A4U43_C04F28860 [Asparagus officinalis]|uniref:PurT/PurK-like preATP-grasp domain-containing protein n=1 Tax=Asparagus officinalis TaxID=4686 RepID=A0A5P1F664_ASPOF|nr:uncharacterized protein A4U43_C04F28860 [Asparagus officinalis]